jgi:hypothetical protein
MLHFLPTPGEYLSYLAITIQKAIRIHLASLDITMEVRQLYRRLSIPAAIEQVRDEGVGDIRPTQECVG